MAMFPLSGVLFPGALLTLHVFEPRYRQLTADCLAGSRELGVVLITRGSEVGGGDVRSAVGTAASIVRAVPLPDGRWFLLLVGTRRITVLRWLADDPYPRAVVEELPDLPAVGHAGALEGALEDALAAVRMARGLMSEAAQGPALPVDLLSGAGGGAADPVLAWRLCEEAPVGPLDRQRLLETAEPVERLALVAELSIEKADDVRRMLAGG